MTISAGQASSISWDATHADECSASGAWSGTKATRGNESTGALTETSAFALTCTGNAGSARNTVSVTVRTADASSPFPLRVEDGKRYLVDARGLPFFIHGDTPWSLAVQLTREEADRYLEDRRQKGFNTVLMQSIEHKFSSNPPANAYGEVPFVVPGDFSTPNEHYFAHLDYIIAKAAEKSMLVMLTPAYMGFGGGDEGWYQEMTRAGTATLHEYGRYIANRLSRHDNILWVHGGDYNPPALTLLNAIADGIREIDTRWLHTFHGSRGTAALEFVGSTSSWLTVNNIYTDESNVVIKALQEYSRSQMPFFLIEARYEGESASAATVRAQAYQAVLSGASGHLMGNHPMWDFSSGWEQALNSAGARTLSHLRNLYASLPWWSLQPDGDGALITSGRGSDASRAACAAAADGSLALCYVPTSRNVTLKLDGLFGPTIEARWYDPTSGSYTTIQQSPFQSNATTSLSSPGKNADGDADWVLVLQSEP